MFSNNLKIKSNTEDSLEIFLDGGISEWEISARLMKSLILKAGDRPIKVQLNSLGGDYIEGASIYNLMMDCDNEFSVDIIGIAASAATLLCFGADNLRISTLSFFMIHNAWISLIGDKHELARLSKLLEDVDNAISELIANNSNLDQETALEYMNLESWFNAEEALELGIVDSIYSDPIKEDDANNSGFNPFNSLNFEDFKIYKNIPELLLKKANENTGGWKDTEKSFKDLLNSIRGNK